MPNSTDEWWSIDGTSLHQYGWNVTTIGGSRYDLPPRRGEDIRLAYRPGAIHRPKLPDSRTVSLIMWVTGADPATGVAASDAALRFNDSWDFLRRLVWKPNGAQITLTRRWNLTVGSVKTLIVAEAQAEIADTMSPTMTGRTRADFTMTLLLADPFFYGPQITEPLNVGQTVAVSNPGHDIVTHANLQVDFVGPLTNPRLTNTTSNPDVWVQYTGTIGSGTTLTLDVGAYTAFAGTTNLIGGISHSGARHWMGLLPGTNSLTFSATSGAGTAAVRYRPPYI